MKILTYDNIKEMVETNDADRLGNYLSIWLFPNWTEHGTCYVTVEMFDTEVKRWKRATASTVKTARDVGKDVLLALHLLKKEQNREQAKISVVYRSDKWYEEYNGNYEQSVTIKIGDTNERI